MRTKEELQRDAARLRHILKTNRENWQTMLGADNIHVEKHSDRSAISMASKAAYEGRSVSSFPDDETMNECICEAIAANAEYILKETDKASDQERMVLTVDMDVDEWKEAGFDPHFTGIARTYTGKLKEMSTTSVDVVYKKDSDKPLGFSIVTAFPNVNCEKATPTGRDITDEVKASRGYRTASPVKRAWLDHALDPSATLNMQYVKHRDKRPGQRFQEECIVINVPTHNDALYHRVFVDNRWTHMQTLETDDSGTHWIQGEYQQMSHGIASTRYGHADLGVPKVRNAFGASYPQAIKEITQVENSRDKRVAELHSYKRPTHSRPAIRRLPDIVEENSNDQSEYNNVFA